MKKRRKNKPNLKTEVNHWIEPVRLYDIANTMNRITFGAYGEEVDADRFISTLGHCLGFRDVDPIEQENIWRVLILQGGCGYRISGQLLGANDETVNGWVDALIVYLDIQKLRSLPYSQYLITDHWASIRKKARARDGNRCRLCNSSERLNVHHRTYERLGCEQDDDVITLCHACHENFHDNRELAS